MPFRQRGNRMKSWSSVKKLLEEDRLAPSLRGRVSYFVTRYRKAHDELGRLAIRVDGEELFQAYPFFGKWDWREERARHPELSGEASWDRMIDLALTEGCGGPYSFYRAFEKYDTQDLEASLVSDNPLVRALAVLDRRVGKRRLKRLAEQGFAEEPAWVRDLFRLRLEAEGIPEPK